MSKIRAEHIFTSESVSEGHPDKVSDQISDAILDACLAQDHREPRRLRDSLHDGSGRRFRRNHDESSGALEKIVRDVIADIGYTSPDVGFSASACKVFLCIHSSRRTSPRESRRVQGLFKEQGAGDQGMMFGYASNETRELMPATILYAHKIVEELARLRKQEPEKYSYLRPDSKSQVSMKYKDGKPVAVTTIVVSHQHAPEMDIKVFEQVVKDVVKKVIPAEFLNDDIEYFVNPTGRFVVGGPNGDTGLTGRKIIVDTYGGVGSHGGGRVLRQGSFESGPFRGLHVSLHRQEHRGCRTCRQV